MDKKGRFADLPARCLALCVGLAIMAFGVAFSIRAALGTSPISSVPYVAGVVSGLSVGTTTVFVNVLLVALQILVLRRRFELFKLLQIPAVVVFGVMIDLGGAALAPIRYSGYWQQWILCAAGIVLVALGVSVEVTADLVTTPGEGLVMAICTVRPDLKFGNVKVAVDCSLVAVAVVLSLGFLGRLDGVREGTVAAAICVGLLTKQFKKRLVPLEAALIR